MAHLDNGPRVGRSQGVIIFWGLVSIFFATASCYYYWKNHEHEESANRLRDEVLTLQDQRDSLNSQKEKLEAGTSQAETQLKTREDFLQDKENKLAAEETRLETLGRQSQTQTQQSQGQTAVMKKFNDAIRKLNKDTGADVVERGGRPVLRVPSPVLFAPGDATLKPDGKALLNQIAQVLNGQTDSFELRLTSYTDSDAEIQKSSADAPAKPEQKKEGKADAASPPRYATGWELTAARATAIELFYRNQTSLPFQNVLAIGRGDADPIVAGGKEGRERNRRIEIAIVPVAAPFHPLQPPPDPPPSPNKAK